MCESTTQVMLKDVGDSKRLDAYVHKESDKQALKQQVHKPDGQIWWLRHCLHVLIVRFSHKQDSQRCLLLVSLSICTCMCVYVSVSVSVSASASVSVCLSVCGVCARVLRCLHG